MPGGFAAAMNERERLTREAKAAVPAEVPGGAEASAGSGRSSPTKRGAPKPAIAGNGSSKITLSTLSYPAYSSALASAPPPPQNAVSHPSRPTSSVAGPPTTPAAPISVTSNNTARLSAPVLSPTAEQILPPGPLPIPPAVQLPLIASGPSTPSAAHFLASGGLSGSHVPQTAAQPAQNRAAAPMMEFNHAIAFVNKIKNRFGSDPETYKQFLEILQTYQKDTRDIAEASGRNLRGPEFERSTLIQKSPQVYEQVTKLFIQAPDLLDEFKQFLPENGVGGLAGMGFGSFMQAAAGAQPLAPEKSITQKRGSKDVKDSGVQKKRRGAGPTDGKNGAQRVRPRSSAKRSTDKVQEIQACSQSRQPLG